MLWLALHVFDVMWLALHVLEQVLAIYGKASSKQASKKTDFTVDLTWWGSLRLAQLNFSVLVILNI